MTATLLETALAGGGGLVRTLRHSYSTSDLRGIQHGPEEHEGQYEGQELRSWQKDSGYQQLEDKESTVQMRTVKGRSRIAAGSAMSLTSESERYGSYREER